MARALNNSGHQVSVITTTAVPEYVRSKYSAELSAGEHIDDGISVHRLKPFFTLGQLVWAKGVKRKLNQIAPDLVLVIGLGKAFPKPALTRENYKLAVLLGDNHHTYLRLDWKQRLLRTLFKRPVYEKGIRAADKIFTYTPETVEVVGEWIGKNGLSKLRQKQVAISLGFDHHWFYFDEALRNKTRSELNIAADETLLITTARMGGNKNFQPLFAAVEKLHEANHRIKCMVVGLGDDDHSEKVRQRLQKSSAATAFITRSFVAREALNELYNAADIGFWPITAISVFEGMGTGLYLMLPPLKSLEHLSLNGECGLYYSDSIAEDVLKAIENLQRFPRTERAAKAVEKFSYQSIARTVLQSVQSG